ncbi:MAG: hypothetical protein WC654_01645 [Patescibacteria group bacterium]
MDAVSSCGSPSPSTKHPGDQMIVTAAICRVHCPSCRHTTELRNVNAIEKATCETCGVVVEFTSSVRVFLGHEIDIYSKLEIVGDFKM